MNSMITTSTFELSYVKDFLGEGAGAVMSSTSGQRPFLCGPICAVVRGVLSDKLMSAMMAA